jgi:hypothetical protein
MKNGKILVGSVLTEFEGVLTGSLVYRGGLESLDSSKLPAKQAENP